jgi:cytochrome c-type biogenesis protein CcmE
MNAARQQKMLKLIIALAVFALAVGLVLYALRQNINLFYTPSQLSAEAPISPHQTIRLGGLVRTGSLVHGQGLAVQFAATDGEHDITVAYTGVLPDLFREGKSMVAEGLWNGRVFNAQRVLAKHDENYMPAEVKNALRGTS